MYKILVCEPDRDPEVREVDKITERLQEYVGPTRAVECSIIPGTSYVVYADMQAYEKNKPMNRIILGRSFYGKFIVAKLDKEMAKATGLTDPEIEAIKQLFFPVKKRFKEQWELN